jgi:hypothetical protein
LAVVRLVRATALVSVLALVPVSVLVLVLA